MADADATWKNVTALVEHANELGIGDDIAQKTFDTLAKASLKQKSITLQIVRRLCAVVGDSAVQVLDGLKDSEAAALVGKLDKANSARAKEDLAWARRRLHDLSMGRAEPDAIPAKVKPPKPPKKEKPTPMRTSKKATALSAKREKTEEPT